MYDRLIVPRILVRLPLFAAQENWASDSSQIAAPNGQLLLRGPRPTWRDLRVLILLCTKAFRLKTPQFPVSYHELAGRRDYASLTAVDASLQRLASVRFVFRLPEEPPQEVTLISFGRDRARRKMVRLSDWLTDQICAPGALNAGRLQADIEQRILFRLRGRSMLFWLFLCCEDWRRAQEAYNPNTAAKFVVRRRLWLHQPMLAVLALDYLPVKEQTKALARSCQRILSVDRRYTNFELEIYSRRRPRALLVERLAPRIERLQGLAA